MSLRNFIRLLQNHSETPHKFFSKLLSNPKLWPKPGENGFSGAGWPGGGHLNWKQFISIEAKGHFHHNNSKWTKLNNQHQQQYVRGLRSGKGEGPTAKTHRNFVFTALEDSGTRMSSDFTTVFVKPALFTAIIATGSFIGSTIWQYENQRNRVLTTGSFTPRPGAQDGQEAQDSFKRFEFRNALRLWWEKASPADKVFWPICALNGLVFAGWHIPGLTARMITYFTATPISRAICWPMLLSTFSHYSILHLGANMFVLHSFLPAAVSLMGPEHFVGAYVGSGVISSFGSHIHKLILGTNVPSLGASGAVMGILAYVCMKMPDIQLGIIFIPGLSFSADTAIKCILAVDSVGLVLGWRLMDHAAHLSGAMYGLGLCYFEEAVITARDKIMRFWHSVRKET